MNKEYTVITTSVLEIFIEHVNFKLKDGWELEGNLSTAKSDNGGMTYSQAFTRLKDNAHQDKQK